MIETKFKIEKGYKIPVEWDVITLGTLGDPLMCKRILKDQTDIHGEVPFFKIGTFGQTPDAYIARELFEIYKTKYSYPRKGDILISAAGTIGRHLMFDGKDAYFQDSNIVWIDNDEKLITNAFLSKWLDVINWETTNGGTITRLYNRNLKDSRIVKPTFKEQQKIAAALSDIDSLISTLKNLIEKKLNVKQGVMQELLSGRRRLKGFSYKWEPKTIFEITGHIKRGQTLKSDDFCFGNIPVVAGGKQYAGFHNVANQFGRTITLSGSGASAGYVALHNIPIFATDCSVIQELDSFSIDFLYYYLSYKQEFLYSLQTGGAQPHVYPRDIEKIVICIPTIDEQIQIAKVLSDIDSEISALEGKLKKFQALKQGMMQQLLTGKIRLI